METQPNSHKQPLVRIIVALMTVVPALAFCGFCFVATPDLESWLAARFDSVARPDAFDGVSQIAPLFAVVFSVTSLLGACLVVKRRTPYLLTLAAGPLLAGLVYIVTHGVTDPAWFTLLALLSIGMLVCSPVTAAWAVISAQRQAVRRRTADARLGTLE